MRSFIDKLMTMEAHSELSTMSELAEHSQSPADPAMLSLSCIHGVHEPSARVLPFC